MVAANVPPDRLYITTTTDIVVYGSLFFAFFVVPTKIRQNKAFLATFVAQICNLSFEQRKYNTVPVNRQI